MVSGATMLHKEYFWGNTAGRVAALHPFSSMLQSNCVIKENFLSEELSEVACMPHPEVIQVEPSVTDERNIPQFVKVNRCNGACDLPLNTEACTPIKTRDVAVKVTFADGTSQTRYVEEHLECGCKCNEELECKAHHDFDEVDCRCICKEMCRENENQDPMTCACTTRVGKRRDEIMES